MIVRSQKLFSLLAGYTMMTVIVVTSASASVVGVTITPVFEAGDTHVFEAENALLSDGFLVETNHSGFTGSSFVNYVNEGYVEWAVNVAESGKFLFSFKYALKYGDRPLDIIVNGAMVSLSTSFPSTGSWDKWGSISTEIMLNPGTNTIRAQTRGISGPNIDRLEVKMMVPD